MEFLALDAGINMTSAFFDRILGHKGLELSGVKQLYIKTGFQATILDNAHVNRFLRVCGVSLGSLKLGGLSLREESTAKGEKGHFP